MVGLAEAIVRFLQEHYCVELAERWYEDPFEVLIGCMLSQRTREENTEAACKALFAVASTPKQILRLPTPKLQHLIKPAGLVRQKASNIKRVCRILIEKHGGEVPRSREALMNLPGVGPKTADVTLCYGFGLPSIPVDTHVARISKRLGLVDEHAKVECIGEELKKLFPMKDWHLINRGFVLFGREICLPRNPKCGVCPLRTLCEFGKQKSS